MAKQKDFFSMNPVERSIEYAKQAMEPYKDSKVEWIKEYGKRCLYVNGFLKGKVYRLGGAWTGYVVSKRTRKTFSQFKLAKKWVESQI